MSLGSTLKIRRGKKQEWKKKKLSCNMELMTGLASPWEAQKPDESSELSSEKLRYCLSIDLSLDGSCHRKG